MMVFGDAKKVVENMVKTVEWQVAGSMVASPSELSRRHRMGALDERRFMADPEQSRFNLLPGSSLGKSVSPPAR